MVDLVKIRKKAREQKEREAAEAACQLSEPAAQQSRDSDSEPAGPTAAERLDRFKKTFSANAAERGERDENESEGTSGSEIEVLTFAIGDEEYAIEIESVVEIVTPGEITRVPNAERNISGIISLRGTIVTILDVRGKLGHERGTADLDTRIVVVRDSGGSAGFIVDKVLRVVKVLVEELDTQPVASPEEQNEMIKGVFRRNDSLSIFLDIDRLLRDDTSHDADL